MNINYENVSSFSHYYASGNIRYHHICSNDNNMYWNSITLNYKDDDVSTVVYCEIIKNSGIHDNNISKVIYKYNDNGYITSVQYKLNEFLHNENGPAHILYYENTKCVFSMSWYINGILINKSQNIKPENGNNSLWFNVNLPKIEPSSIT